MDETAPDLRMWEKVTVTTEYANNGDVLVSVTRAGVQGFGRARPDDVAAKIEQMLIVMCCEYPSEEGV